MEIEKTQLEHQPVKQKNKIWKIVGISIAAVVVVLVMASLLLLNLPQVMTRLLIINTPNVLEILQRNHQFDSYEMSSQTLPTESQKTITNLSINNLDIPLLLEFPIQLEDVLNISSSYDSESQNSEVELSTNIEGFEIFNSDMYVNPELFLMKSDYLLNTYVIELDQQQEFNNPTSSVDLEYEIAVLRDSLTEIGKDIFINFPFKNFSKGKQTIEILNEDKEVRFIEIDVKNDEMDTLFNMYIKSIKENQDLEAALDSINEKIFSNNQAFIDSTVPYGAEEIDMYENILSAINELKSVDYDNLIVTIYYQNLTPIAYKYDFEDSNMDYEVFATIFESTQGDQIKYDLKFDQDQIVFDYCFVENQTDIIFNIDIKEVLLFETKFNNLYENDNKNSFKFNSRVFDYYDEFEFFFDLYGENELSETQEKIKLSAKLHDTEYEPFTLEFTDIKVYEESKTSEDMKIYFTINEINYFDIVLDSKQTFSEKSTKNNATIALDFYFEDIEGKAELEFNSQTEEKSSLKVTIPTFSKDDADVAYIKQSELLDSKYFEFISIFEEDINNYLYYMGF